MSWVPRWSGHCHGNRSGRTVRDQRDCCHETRARSQLPPPLSRRDHQTRCLAVLYVFSLSLRDVELLLAERGVVVSYETVRRWCKKFGQSFAECLRRR